MNVNFNHPVKNPLTGETLKENGEDLNIGKLLGNHLVHKPEGDYLKQVSLGKKIYDGVDFDLDPSDEAVLRSQIAEWKVNAFIKAQADGVLTDAKFAAAEKK